MWHPLRQCLALLSPADRIRWLRVLPMILLGSLIEALSAASVFTLVSVITAPESAPSLPWIGGWFEGEAATRDEQWGLVLAVAGLYAFKAVVLAVTDYLQGIASAQSAAGLAIRLLTGYVNAPYLFHLRRNSSDLVDTTTRAAGHVFSTVTSALVYIIAECAVLFGILAVLVAASPTATLATASILFLLGNATVRALRNRSQILGKHLHELSQASMRLQVQLLGAIDEISILGRGQEFVDRFAVLRGKFARQVAINTVVAGLPRITIETVFILGALGVTALLLSSGSSSAQAISLLGLFAYAGFRIIPSVNRILNHLLTVRVGRAAIEQIERDLNEIEVRGEASGAGTNAATFDRAIELRNVELRYPNTDAATLTDVSFEILPHQSTALVGKTGSGKSSVIRLLTGLLTPTEGEILLDGSALAGCLQNWRQHLGYVPQEVHLIDDSLLNNVAFGVPTEEIDLDRVSAAVARAQLDDVIAGLPDGWDTVVGDRGVRLSGGERQRVGIARAFYRNPPVMIFDEATSSLDAETEARLLDEARSVDSTLIVITHRLSTIRGFDQLVFFDGGTAAASGTYTELNDTTPAFRAIAEANEAI